MPNPQTANSPSPPDELTEHLWLPSDWCELNFGVSLSGGADSVALLRAIHRLKQQQGGAGQVIAFHVDHQLRGAESFEDAQWCEQQCQSLGVPLEIMTCDTAKSVVETGDGIEATARAQRYELLTTAAEQAGVRYLATAHTQDDQVETVLFRLLRGTGLRGVSGIPRSRVLTPSLTLIRPLLGCSREMVIDYLSNLGQTYRIDRTNADTKFTRNRLRHELLPQLRKQYNPEINAALLRLATQASETQGVIEFAARALLENAKLPTNPSNVTLNLQKFSEQQPLLVSEALRIAWREAGFPEQAMTRQWWNQLTRMATHSDEEQILNLPGNIHASIDGQLLILQR